MLNTALASIEASLDIEGVGSFELVGYNDSFAINDIPTASCVLAAGRKALSEGQVASINSSGGKLTSMAKARVTVNITGDEWEGGSQVIFHGRLTGLGLRKNNGNIQFVAHLIHWLADLSYASMLSEQSHPSNPADLTYAANAPWRLQTIGVGDAARPVVVNQLAGMDFLNPSNVAADFWGNALHPFFCSIATRDTIEDGERGLAGVVGARKANSTAQTALSLIEGPECGKPLSKYNVPLSFNFGGADGLRAKIAEAMARSVGNASVESFATTTIWDVLVGALAPRFMFGVVPLVESAMVVPVIPGLRSTYDSSILVSDYDFVDLSANIPRTLRAVGIYGNIQYQSGARDPGAGRQGKSIGGYYSPQGLEEGMFLFKAAPDWLNNIFPYASSFGNTIGVLKQLPRSSSTTPEDNEGLRGGTDGKTRGEAAASSKDVFDAVARAFYIAEALRGRLGMLSGKLRFDIAPGSTIKIQGSQEKFMGGKDALAQNLVGMAVRVSNSFNAEAGAAGTGFQIAHLRTEHENGKEATSVDSHPLYDTKFLGAPLVEAYK